jgi:hypothetical protein
MVDEETVDAEWVGRRYAVGVLVAGEGTARGDLESNNTDGNPRSKGSNGMSEQNASGSF